MSADVVARVISNGLSRADDFVIIGFNTRILGHPPVLNNAVAVNDHNGPVRTDVAVEAPKPRKGRIIGRSQRLGPGRREVRTQGCISEKIQRWPGESTLMPKTTASDAFRAAMLSWKAHISLSHTPVKARRRRE